VVKIIQWRFLFIPALASRLIFGNIGGVNNGRAIEAPATRAAGQPFISKSKYLWGLQCPKLLWHAYNAKELIPEPDAARQAIFDQGHEVGALAKKLFPRGVEVGDGVLDLDETLRLTADAVQLRQPLFEAAFAAEGAYCRVDVLKPVSKDAWDLIEVKSTTSLKDVHLEDLAFQSRVLTAAGLKIRACGLMHINPDFVRRGDIDPKKFFVLEDLSQPVADLSRIVEDKLGDMFKTIRLPAHPDIVIGPRCDEPYTCPLHDHCWRFLPEGNVTTLYRGGRKGFELLAAGVTALAEIPEDVPLTDNQAIQRQAAVTGKPHIDRAAIRAFLDQLVGPVSFLDFETFGTAMPLFDGLRPYQQVPFQFSLHVQRSAGRPVEHFKFLAEGGHDPRRDFMRRLREVLPAEGSVVAYNAGFELGRLSECCEALREFRSWLKTVEVRVVDLLVPFREFRYYHPQQHGSASMKAVLPVLTGKGYEQLAIQEGNTASREFLRVVFGAVAETERRRVREQLEAYCGQDTEGMIWIVEALRQLV
jgi:hypothetical protein